MRPLIFLLFSSVAFSQTLPDAPKPQHRERWGLFVAVATADVGLSVYDSWITEQGLHAGHGCTEANGGDPMPSAGKLYGKNLAITGGLIGLGVIFKRLHLPIAPFAPMGIDAFKHGRGVYRWYHFKNGACL